MTSADLSPEEAARWAHRAGLPLGEDRLAVVAATANHIQAVLSTLRELEFGDTPPAPTFDPRWGARDAAV
ncbi:hypothetical protein [Nonomuraea lactucae]|uniref:hypothetical protein n=1 Tax=Nonomuraea lactucae TaxID=2249762 RepID=UPI000DE31E05|nr:hypothetical protein [Nonomuraea lactucae]